MTKMIFIPPFQMLDSTLHYYRHLMLPHLLTASERYVAHFKRAKRLGQYIILDNGAAEGVEAPSRLLVDTCYDYGIDELVLPDVMGDPYKTYEVAMNFLVDYRNKLPVSTRLGYVLQGQTAAEVIDTYHRTTLNQKLLTRINVWYLPRLLVTEESPHARIEVAEHILSNENAPRRPIHFLGAAPSFINEVTLCRDRLRGRVRSMDTSAPYVYALAGKFIGDLGVAHRDQERYFTSLVDNDTRTLATRNCDVMDGWSGAKTSSGSM